MKKNAKRIISLVMVFVLVLCLLSGCGAKSDVNKTLNNFENACKTLDLRAILDCLNPTIAKPVLSVLDFIGITDTSSTLEEVVNLLGLFNATGEKTTEFLSSISIKPIDYSFNSDNDECSVTATLSYGSDKEETVTIKLILEDEVWYISGFDF